MFCSKCTDVQVCQKYQNRAEFDKVIANGAVFLLTVYVQYVLRKY